MSVEKAPAFQFYAQDFLTGVMYMSNEEIGMYIKMLSKQWTDGKIPKKRLGFLVGISWDKLSDELKSKFEDKGDYVINSRLEEEREKKHNFFKKQAENGKKGGRPKKQKPKLNPNKSQKKPLEDEDEKEVEVRSKKKEDVVYPFDTEKFKRYWGLWLDYKSKEFNFKYKSEQSEQAALKKLANYSQNNESKAIQIIEESMANGWKGFFEIKNGKNGNKESSTERAARYFNSQTDDVFADYPGN